MLHDLRIKAPSGLAAALAIGSILAAGSPAAAFPLSQYVTAASLKAHCDASGGVFTQAGNLSGCATDKGNVACDSKTKKCTGSNGSASFQLQSRFWGVTAPSVTIAGSLVTSSASAHVTEIQSGGSTVSATTTLSVH